MIGKGGASIGKARIASRGATFTIAPANASDDSKNQADIVCVGTSSNAVDEEVINAAVAAFPSNGGKILLLEGSFYIGAPIDLAPSGATGGIILEGMGPNATRIYLGSGSNCNMVEIVPPANDTYFTQVCSLTLQGQKSLQTSGSGIYTSNSGGYEPNDVRLYDMFIANMKDKGLYLDYMWGYRIFNVLTEFCGNDGVYMHGGESYISGLYSADNGGNGIEFASCYDIRGDTIQINTADETGLALTGTTTNVGLMNVSVKTWGQGGANNGVSFSANTSDSWIVQLMVDGDATAASDIGVYILGDDNIVAFARVKDCVTGIYVYGAGAARNQVLYPNISNCTYKFADSGTDTVIVGGIGYVTHNSGSSTGTGAEQTIAHGLSFTPTGAQIILWNIEDGANPYHSSAPDATNIYVTAVVDKDWGWSTVPR